MKKMKSKRLRLIVQIAVFALVIASLATNFALGTPSGFGIGAITAICPLGAIEVWIASNSFIPLAFVSLLCFVVLGVIFGKVFCAWICPAPLWMRLRDLLKSKGRVSKEVSEKDEKDDGFSQSAEGSREERLMETKACPSTGVAPSVFHAKGFSRPRIDSRFAVLVGACASTAVFGFPVFCLVCPVGLTFAAVIALWRLFFFQESTWLLVVAPVVIILELVVFHKWCDKICPLGAVMSLAASLNKRLRPAIDERKCLRLSSPDKPLDCRICKESCSYGIDLHDAVASKPLVECTKCRDCADNCPVLAITFK